MKRESTLKLFKSKVLLLILSLFLLFNCQKEELENGNVINEQKDLFEVRKINYEDLKTDENLTKYLSMIDKNFDFNKNKQNKKVAYSKIRSVDSSFSILTDEIIQVFSDSTEVYTFKIEFRTHQNSDFENFIIEKYNNGYQFYIYRYQQILIQESGNIGYKLSKQKVNEEEINIGDFEDVIGYDMLYDSDTGCFYRKLYDENCQCSYISIVDCFGGGSGSSSSSSSNDFEDTGDMYSESNFTNTGSSGGGDSSASNNNPVGILLSPEAKMLDLFDSTLTTKQKDCLTSNLGLQSEIKTFLLSHFDATVPNMQKQISYAIGNKASNTSLYTLGDAQTFSKLVLDNCGADVDWGEHIINELEGKELCIHELLNETGHSFVKNIFSKFEGESEFDIKIESKDRVYKKNGDEVNGKTIKNSLNNIITIQINTYRMSSSKALQVARTILHEYIHADMFRKLKTKYPTTEDLDFRTTYEKFKADNFIASAQHESMAALYIGEMTNALKNFHKNALVGDYNYLTDNGTNPLPDNFYEAIAWQGLKEHGVKEYTDLLYSKKKALEDSLKKYIHSTTSNCPNN